MADNLNNFSTRVDVLEVNFSNVQTEAKETTQTLKELRGEVKELRVTLENTEIGSQDFAKTLDTLTRKQQELTNVTKSGVAAQKGSYNDLVNQMAILKTQWRSTSDEMERTAIGMQIADINTRLKELDGSIGNHQREVGNYRTALKQLKEDLLQLEEGTEEYNQKLKEAADISQRMQDVNEFVAASAQDMGDHLANAAGVAAGMVGFFQSAQAALQLVGVESENVNQVIAKMQSLMAITQGLTAIEGAIDKYKRLNNTIKSLTVVQNIFNTTKGVESNMNNAATASTVADTTAKVASTTATNNATAAQLTFNKAVKANPLGLLLTVITAVVVGLTSLASWLKKVGDESDNIARINEQISTTLEKQNKDAEFKIALAQAEGKTRKQALYEYLNIYKKAIDDTWRSYNDVREKAKARGGGLFGSPISKEEQKEIDASYDLYVSTVEAYNAVVREIQLETVREQTEAQKRIAESRKQVAADFKNTVASLQQDLIMKSLSDYGKDVQTLTEHYRLEEKKWKEHYNNGMITKKQFNDIIFLLEENYRGDLQDLAIRKNKEDMELLKKSLDDQLKAINTNRNRIMRGYREEENALRTTFENVPQSLNMFSMLDKKESYYRDLEELYDKNLLLIKNQDTLERGYINAQIKLLNEKRDASGMLTEADQTYYDQLIDKLSMVGAEAANLEAKLVTTRENIAEIATEQSLIHVEFAKQQIEEFKNIFVELNDIGGAFSSEWEEFFNIMVSGLDNTITGLKDMEEVLRSDASAIDKTAARWKGYGQLAASALGATASLMGTLSDAQDKTSKDGFETSKKFQIAQATMNMLQGVVAAWASCMPLGPIAGPIAGAALSAIITGVGLAQIAQIKKTKYESGSGSTNPTSAISSSSLLPSSVALGGVSEPVQTVNTIEGASVESDLKDTRVYVVESDITHAQNQVKTSVEEASF